MKRPSHTGRGVRLKGPFAHEGAFRVSEVSWSRPLARRVRLVTMRSDTIKRGFERAPHRSLLRATGQIRSPNDFDKPFVAVCNSYVDIVPGHVHLQEFGRVVKDAIRGAGGVPFEFKTIGVDDGIIMGHDGMRYSLPSRELIADAVETMAQAHCFDASEFLQVHVTRHDIDVRVADGDERLVEVVRRPDLPGGAQQAAVRCALEPALDGVRAHQYQSYASSQRS